jgi:hypothetical protein
MVIASTPPLWRASVTSGVAHKAIKQRGNAAVLPSTSYDRRRTRDS